MKPFFISFSILLLLSGCISEKVVLDNEIPKQIENTTSSLSETNVIQPVIISDWQYPLDRASERVTKKFFGTKVSPTDSPIQPERFSGYHTAIDFEIFIDEAETVVPVRAACTGKVLQRRIVSGYGGVVVQNCNYNNQPVTVVYGHLDINSVSAKIGSMVSVGESLGNLGKGYSSQTDGERKHLHFGIHRGTTVSILGYVSQQSDLTNWIDPLTVFKK